MLNVTIQVLIMSRCIVYLIYTTFMCINNGCSNADNFIEKVLASFCFSVYKQQKGSLYLRLICRCLKIVSNCGNLHPVSLGQEHFAQTYTMTEKFQMNVQGVIYFGYNSNHVQPTFANARIPFASIHRRVSTADTFGNHSVRFMMLYCRNLVSLWFTVLAIACNSIITTNYN